MSELIESNNYIKLARIDVSSFSGERNKLTYLPWSWAVDQLLRQDGTANWSWLDPVTYNDTMMVGVAVTAFGKTMIEWLPVMDHRNKAISNPDVCAINNAQRRCLTKCIALHGIGINIYQGEDLPLAVDEAMDGLISDIKGCKSIEELEAVSIGIRDFTTEYPSKSGPLREAYKFRREQLGGGLKEVKAKGVAGLKERLEVKEQ